MDIQRGFVACIRSQAKWWGQWCKPGALSTCADTGLVSSAACSLLIPLYLTVKGYRWSTLPKSPWDHWPVIFPLPILQVHPKRQMSLINSLQMVNKLAWQSQARRHHKAMFADLLLQLSKNWLLNFREPLITKCWLLSSLKDQQALQGYFELKRYPMVLHHNMRKCVMALQKY